MVNDYSPVQSRVTPLIEDMDPLEQVMREIEVDLEALGWDQRPSFWLVMRAADIGLCAFTIEMPPQVYWNPGIFLPMFVEHLKRSPSVEPLLAHVRRVIKGAGQMVGREVELYAMGAFNEAWILLVEGELTDELCEQFEDREIHAHPDRIEQRCGSFVTVDGEHALLARSRGEAPEIIRGSAWGPDGSDGATVTGNIPEALHDFLALLTVDMK